MVDCTVNPVAIAAFVLTCFGCVQTIVAVALSNWWTLIYSNNFRTYYGVWTKLECNNQGFCQSDTVTELEGGQEALFISKVFATITPAFCVVAVVCHIIYFFVRRPLIRSTAIFILGAAGLFGLFATFVFVGFYSTVDGDTSLGVAFVLFVVGSIFCLVAAVLTAWASIRKATTPSGLIDAE